MTQVSRLSYKITDWKKFRISLAASLHRSGISTSYHIGTPHELDSSVEKITQAVQEATVAHEPKVSPSPYTKRRWTSELSSLRRQYAKLRRAHFVARGSQGWEAAKAKSAQAHNKYTAALRNMKAAHWKNWLENVMEEDILKVSRIAQNPPSDGGKARIPTLYSNARTGGPAHEHNTDAKKCKLLVKTFPPKLDTLPALPDATIPLPPQVPFALPHTGLGVEMNPQHSPL